MFMEKTGTPLFTKCINKKMLYGKCSNQNNSLASSHGKIGQNENYPANSRVY